MVSINLASVALLNKIIARLLFPAPLIGFLARLDNLAVLFFNQARFVVCSALLFKFTLRFFLPAPLVVLLATLDNLAIVLFLDADRTGR